MTKIAIFSSHNGSGFEALYEASIKKELDIEIGVIISNNSAANVLKKAKNLDIPNYIVNDKVCDNVENRLVELLKEYRCEYIFLSGYMKKISPLITNNYKVINSHPALLPAYGGAGMYGKYVHEAVVANKEKNSGVTIHEVNENYDEGAIILQNSLTLDENETPESLETKIKALEKITIVQGFQKCLN
ncbi:MAG: phosphoribosylglycinamide formyltransferase [Campylobacterota bacterium]|nr:phosphoribosylglycinamide formyltransferase [Campylobacterota bacterium]